MSSKALILGAFIALALFLGVGYLLGRTDTARAPETAPSPSQEPVPPVIVPDESEDEPVRVHIERDTVENLYYGISYEYAKELFGFPSDEYDTEYDPGVSGYTSPFVIHWHEWINEDGSKARLGFVNNKMDRKQYIADDGVAELPDPVHLDVEEYGRILGLE